jgi:hypothetical protein
MIQLFELIGFSFIICFILKAVFSKPKLSSPQETLDKSLTKAVDMGNVAKDNIILGDDKSVDLLHSDGDKNWPSWSEEKRNIISAVTIPQETLDNSLTKTVDMGNVAKDNIILCDDKSVDLLHSADDKKLVKSVGKKVKTLIGVAAVVIFVLVPQALPIALVLLFLGGFLFLISSFVGFMLEGLKGILKNLGSFVDFILDGLKEILKKSLRIIVILSLCAGYIWVLSELLQGVYMDILDVYRTGLCESHKIYNFLVGVVNFFANLGFKIKGCDFNVTILVLLAKLALIAFLTYLFLQRCYKWIFSENLIDK